MTARRRSIAGFALPALLLAGCGSDQPAPGGVTADEAAALNEAAEMLDVNSVDADALDNTGDVE